jgi:RNA polymerase sigma factor (sigma-70 family)
LGSISSYINLTDEEILAAFRNNADNRLLGILLQRYTMLLLGVAMKYLKDKDESHDAVQQVFLKAITHLPKGEISNFKGWLYILMRNHCLQQLRDKTYKAPEEALNYVRDVPTNLEEIQLHNYTLEQMNESLGELSEEQKNCIQLFYLEKQSYQQIMERTGLNFAQVKSHIQNGKRNLKIILLKKLGNRQ